MRQKFGLRRWGFLLAIATIAGVAFMAACGDDDDDASGDNTSVATAARQNLSGTVEIDGSSTVYPVTQAMAEEFQKENRNVRVTVGISGTGGGFQRFCAGEIPIGNASRPISETEKAACAAKGIQYTEMFVAFDGLSAMANPRDTFVDCLTTAELKKIWDQGSTITNWKDVRAGFPRQAAGALRRGHGLRHVRLLHRSHQRQGEAEPRRLHQQ